MGQRGRKHIHGRAGLGTNGIPDPFPCPGAYLVADQPPPKPRKGVRYVRKYAEVSRRLHAVEYQHVWVAMPHLKCLGEPPRSIVEIDRYIALRHRFQRDAYRTRNGCLRVRLTGA